jgi:hypothetical protein
VLLGDEGFSLERGFEIVLEIFPLAVGELVGLLVRFSLIGDPVEIEFSDMAVGDGSDFDAVSSERLDILAVIVERLIEDGEEQFERFRDCGRA